MLLLLFKLTMMTITFLHKTNSTRTHQELMLHTQGDAA